MKRILPAGLTLLVLMAVAAAWWWRPPVPPEPVRIGETDGWLYKTADGRGPAVIVLPHLAAGARYLEGPICAGLARRGITTLLLLPTYYFDHPLSKPLQASRPSPEVGGLWITGTPAEQLPVAIAARMRLSLAEVESARRWLVARGADPARIGLLGVSFGSFVAVTAAGNGGRPGGRPYERQNPERYPGVRTKYAAAVYLLGGADIAALLSHAPDVQGFREQLAAGRRTRFPAALRNLDPLANAGVAAHVPTLMLNARWDTTVPRGSALALHAALGRPALAWVPAGHYSSAVFLPYLRWKAGRFLARILTGGQEAAPTRQRI